MTLTTIAVTPVLLALVALDVADVHVRRWFDAHAFTSDVLTSILVLLITVLIVDRVVRARQLRDRAQVVGAQAAIVGRQAQRTLGLVRAALEDPEQSEPASDELRTYMGMLLVSAPLLIDAPQARTFLQDAQRLAGLLSRALSRDRTTNDASARLEAAAQAVRDSAGPLVAALDHAQLRAVESDPDAG